MAKVAFLGLGVMGYPMAGHLKNKGGHEVTVYNRTAAKAEQWVKQYGGKSAATPKAASQGQDLVTNWLAAGVEFDAVIANNDEMAIGAVQALKAAGRSMDSVVIAGVDATQDALAAMAAGDLDVTVFQDAAGQGKGALDAAIKLAKGEKVEAKVYIPFQLVTPANIAEYQQKN